MVLYNHQSRCIFEYVERYCFANIYKNAQDFYLKMFWGLTVSKKKILQEIQLIVAY